MLVTIRFRSEFPNEEVLAYSWNNVWEWGSGSQAYILANADFKVVPVSILEL